MRVQRCEQAEIPDEAAARRWVPSEFITDGQWTKGSDDWTMCQWQNGTQLHVSRPTTAAIVPSSAIYSVNGQGKEIWEHLQSEVSPTCLTHLTHQLHLPHPAAH